MPRLCEVYPGICLTTEEKARKNLSQGSRRMPVGKEYTEQSILVNKNTISLGGQQKGHETDYSSLYSAKVEDERSYTSARPCRHSVRRDNFSIS